MKKKILVIDVGGTHVKLMISRAEKRKFDSGLTMTPREMVTQMQPLLEDWSFAAVSVGFPSPVRAGRILSDPKHLGRGWVGFDFEKALGKPVRIINDAAMQALGSYHGRRMLFLGLGTGLGSALVWNFSFSDMAKPIGPTGRNRTTNVRLRSVGKKKCTKSLPSLSDLRCARTLS